MISENRELGMEITFPRSEGCTNMVDPDELLSGVKDDSLLKQIDNVRTAVCRGEKSKNFRCWRPAFI